MERFIGLKVLNDLPTTSPNPNEIYTVCFSPNEAKWLCCAGEDKLVTLRYSERNYKVERVFERHNETILDSDFSPDGLRVATASEDESVLVWEVDVEDGDSIILGDAEMGSVNAVRFLNPTKVVTGCDNGLIKVWNFERDISVRTFKTGEGNCINCIDVHPQPSRPVIISGDICGSLIFWDPRVKKKALIQFTKLRHNIFSVHIHDNPNSYCAALYDPKSETSMINIYDLRKSVKALQSHKVNVKYVNEVHFHPSGKYVVCACEGVGVGEEEEKKNINCLKIIDVERKCFLRETEPISSPSVSLTCARFSPDGRSYAVGNREGKVKVVDFPYNRLEGIESINAKERLEFLVSNYFTSPDPDVVVVAGRRNVLMIRINNFCTLHGFKFSFLL